MKLARLIGLACVAAITVLALVGTSSAMASTALCSADEDPCSEENQLKHVHYEAENLVILTSTMNYECNALLLAEVSKLGESQTLEISSLVYTSCNQGCTRTVEEPGTFSITHTETELGEIVGSGTLIHVVCSSKINCTYAFNELGGSVEGSLLTEDNGRITYKEATLEKVGGLMCPTTAKLDAVYIASEPVYVSS